ncbi:MAG: glycosyl transferase family 1, partial [Bacteroidetes bacterium]|nr:glycosyl transferase family 1 [Bacteroidota bacterium]
MSAFSVLVDARGTQEGFKQHRQRGLGHYAVNLLERLPHMPTRGTLNYLIESGRPIEEFISGSGVQLTTIRPPRARSFPGQAFAYQRILPAPMRKSACDFAHFLFHLDAPLYSPIPTIVTIPDLIPHRMKQSYSWERRVKNSVQFRLERAIGHRAEAIIAISEFTRRDIVDHLQVDPGKVSVVYLGVHERFFQRLDPEALARVRSLYHLPDRFILYLGGIDPRKNVPSLVDAWGELWNDSRFRIPLVLAG